ncbi:MAG: LCP family protein [Pseudonocardiaceae bacterium]
MADENSPVALLPEAAPQSSPPPTAPWTRQARRALTTGKVLVSLVTCLVFLVTGTGWGATLWLDRQLRDVLALDPDSDSITDAGAQRGDENILLVGSDTRAGAQQHDNVGDTTVVRGARSDTVMIAHVPADLSRAVIVSFPRDLEIRRPPCAVWDPVSGTYAGQQDPGAAIAKLNSAYEIGGPLCLTRVVQHLSGLAVTRFVGVDFQGFKEVVDAVGGVPVCVERPLDDDELGMIIPQAGHSRIPGNTALSLVRARHVPDDPTGDYGRITRQQRFLSALLREVLAPAVLLDPGRLRAVIEAVTTNALGENIGTASLLNLARSLNGLDPARVTFVTVPTTGEANARGNEELRPRTSAALFRAIIDGTPLPGEAPPGDATGAGGTTGAQAPALSPPVTTNSPAPAPSAVQVQVLNGAGIAGVAGQASRQLQEAGFGVLEIADSADRVDTTTIRYPPAREAEALTLLAALPDAVLQADQAITGAVVLVVGPDFDTVTPPDTTPTPPSPTAQLGDLTTVNAADATCS